MIINSINSSTNKLIKYFNKLKDNSFSKQKKKFLIEGEHLIELAIDNLDCILTKSYLKKYESIKQYIVNDEILEKLSSGKSSARVIGVCNYLLDNKINSNILVYLNRVQDPGNLGTIIRTCLAFSYYDICLDEGCAFKYNNKVVQASQGAIFKENIISLDFNGLIKLKENGYKIYVTTLSNDSISLEKVDKIDEKVIIVFGNEGQGVDKNIIDIADKKIKINMSNIDSLNVAISAGIILYNFTKFNKNI